MYRQIDGELKESVYKLRELIEVMLDAQYVSEKIKLELRDNQDNMEYEVRKIYQMLLAGGYSFSGMGSTSLDVRLKVSDIKRLFVMNNRMIDSERIRKYLILPATSGTSETDLSYEQFASLFCPKGK